MKQWCAIILALTLLTCCTTGSKYNAMRTTLDSLNQLNRSSQPFTTADAQRCVDYFDRHGNANDQLLAHYLLGRAYHEQGEAPMALHCYQEAIDHADTTATDCDFSQLSRVYGQMSDIYLAQNLNYEQIKFSDKAYHYSIKAGDSLSAMLFLEQQCNAYDELDNFEKALIILDSAASWYKQHGYNQFLTKTYGRAIPLLFQLHQIEKAREFSGKYEKESGLFDRNNNIITGLELYYYYKGQLYLEAGKLDSAEFFFRKGLHDGKDFNNQNADAYGLAMLFQKINQPDSAAKYFSYAYAMNDSIYAQMESDKIIQMSELYNYSRYQELAQKKSEEAQQAKHKLLLYLIAFGIIAFIVLLYIRDLILKGKSGLKKYLESLDELRSARSEVTALKQDISNYDQLITKKEKEISTLEKKISRYGKQIYFSTANAERCLKASPTLQEIEKLGKKGLILNDKQWEELFQLTAEYLPGFDDYMETYKPQFPTYGYKICLLLRLHFKPSVIANFIGISKSHVSQICTEMMSRCFKSKGSSRELAAFLTKIF